jgi:hypothetical protein
VIYRQVSKGEFLELVADLGPAADMVYNMYMAFAEAGCECRREQHDMARSLTRWMRSLRSEGPGGEPAPRRYQTKDFRGHCS